LATLLPIRFGINPNHVVVANRLDEQENCTGVEKSECPENSPFNREAVFGSPSYWSAAPPFFVHAWAQAEPGDEDGFSAAETEAVYRGGSRSPRGRGLKEYLSARSRSLRFFLFRHVSHPASWHPYFILILAPHNRRISTISDFIHDVEEISNEGKF
jgi:hypothetical protein